MYIDNFFLALSIMKTLNALKQFLVEEYNKKDFGEVKTIIEQQIKWDTIVSTLKIHQSAFMQDLVIEKKYNNYNTNVIPMKPGLFIEILD